LSDQQIGFDVARVTTSLKEHGVKDQDLAREIAMMREMQKTQYVEMQKSEEAILNKIRSEQKAKATTNKSSAVTDIPQSEKDALKALYDATGGANWKNKTGWDFSKPVTGWNFSNSGAGTGWYGITIANGHVVKLELNYNNLVGNIPAEIGQFSQLDWLNLGSNNLSGSIPSEIGQLTQLTYLDFQRNREISGVIPSQIGQLTKLIWLRLLNNKLTGSIPPEIGQLLQLKELNLSFNNLNGVIPPQMGQLVQLENIDLQVNKLEGTIPLELYKLNKLIRLTLAANQLSGGISSQISQLINLNSLNLMNNKLEGNIPVEVGQLTKLVGIFIQNNKFFGTIPSLINLIDFKDLNIYNNNFRFVDFATDYSTYKTKLRYFYYAPQEKIDVEKTISGSTNGRVTLKMFEDNRFTPEDTFQWYKGVSPNGVLIPGATSREYTITNLKTTDAGDYYCISKNSQITNSDPSVYYQNLVLERNPITLKVVNCTPKTGELKLPTQQVFVGESANFSFEQTAGTVIS
ncbi:leucine-rich repeat domain-containing protein, partial [Flavobacterium polysaccharolyticum]